MTSNQLLIENIQLGKTYEFRVLIRCQNDDIQEPIVSDSAIYLHKIPAQDCSSENPIPPSSVEITDVTEKSVSIKWKNIFGSMGTLFTYGQQIILPKYWKTITVCDPKQEIVLDGLESNQEYGFYLISLCEACVEDTSKFKHSVRSELYTFKTLVSGFESTNSKSESLIQIYPNPNDGNFSILVPDVYNGSKA